MQHDPINEPPQDSRNEATQLKQDVNGMIQRAEGRLALEKQKSKQRITEGEIAAIMEKCYQCGITVQRWGWIADRILELRGRYGEITIAVWDGIVRTFKHGSLDSTPNNLPKKKKE